jgi:hypothetical protein
MQGSTQQVLVALAGISGAVIVAAVLSRLYPNRPERSLPVALFEATVVGVTVISATLTAESALVALYRDCEVASSTMSHIAWPLAFGVVLLIVLSMASRFAGTTREPWAMLPILLSVVYLVVVAGFVLNLDLSTGQLWTFVVVILLLGGLLALVAWRFEVLTSARGERALRLELARRWRGPMSGRLES